MEAILLHINQIPQDFFLIGLFFLMLMTCMGMIPSHTDVTLLASSLVATNGKFPFFAVMFVILGAMLIGENSMFIIGNKYGSKFFKLKLFNKMIPPEKRTKLQKGFHQYPNRFLLALRMSPVLRPYIYLTVGSMGLSHKTFFKYHLKWTVLYVFTVYTVSFYGSKIIMEKFNFPPLYVGIAVFAIWLIALRWINKSLEKLNS